jgi:Spy/CpxP family protein refolding chaperone
MKMPHYRNNSASSLVLELSMKTFNCFAALAAALLAGGLTASPLPAANAPAPDGPLHGALREKIKEKLGLTDDQVAQIKTQLKSERENITSLLTRLHDARTAVRDAVQKPDATETSVREAAAKLAAAQSDLAVERFKLRGKIDPILTPEQREKLTQFRAGLDRLARRAIRHLGDKPGE